MVTEINMNEFDEMLVTNMQAAKVIMFFGPTCGPCKATMPNYEAAANFFLSRNCKMEFFKLNAWEPEEQKNFCNAKGISGVPHFKAFHNGVQLTERVGGGDESYMIEFLQEIVDLTFKQYGEKL